MPAGHAIQGTPGRREMAPTPASFQTGAGSNGARVISFIPVLLCSRYVRRLVPLPTEAAVELAEPPRPVIAPAGAARNGSV